MLPSKHDTRITTAAGPASADPLRTHREQNTLAAVAGFLRALHVLLRSARLYPAQHPRYQESLSAAERELRAAHEWVEPIEIRVEPGTLILESPRIAGRHRILGSKSGELAGLAEELARRGITTLTIQQCTHLGELSTLAALFHSTPASLSLGTEWARVLAHYRIHGILINAPREEGKAESLVSGLVASVLVPELPKLMEAAMSVPQSGTVSGPAAQNALPSKPANPEECLAVLRLLVKIATLLRGNANAGVQDAAASLGRTLAEAERRAAAVLVAAMTQEPPQPGEALEPYGARLAQSLVLEFCIEHHRKSRGASERACPEAAVAARRVTRKVGDAHAFGVREVRAFLHRAGQELSASSAAATTGLDSRWQEEAFLEYLYELFWTALTPREKLEVMRGPQAWCAPSPALRHHLEEVAKPEEARGVVLHYTRALALPEAQARLAVASGLTDICPVIEQLWLVPSPRHLGEGPAALPPELIRLVIRALMVERAPEVGGVLTALTDTLAMMALRKGDFASYEQILEALENERGAGSSMSAVADGQEHLFRLRERLLGSDRWQMLVDAALSPSGGTGTQPVQGASLPRLLGRQPERLLDDLGARLHSASPPVETGLAGTPGLSRLPEMARLVQAIGEPAVGALVARLHDPRTQRATTAAKLLMAWPQGADRLLEALPRALPNWDWNLQDMVVSELSRLNVPGCGSALLEALPQAHPLVVPMILDQIGLASGPEAAPMLIAIAAGQPAAAGFKEVFVRIKAVEALGRLGTRELPAALRAEAAALLRSIMRQRTGLTHAEPAGVRAAAEEALALIENHPASARVRTAYQAVAKASVSFQQPRRYLRIPLDSPLRARVAPAATRHSPLATRHSSVRVSSISLGGAFLETAERLNLGDSVEVQIQSGLRRIQGTAVVRNVTPSGGGVEFVHMNMDDREKLRRLVNRLMRTN